MGLPKYVTMKLINVCGMRDDNSEVNEDYDGGARSRVLIQDRAPAGVGLVHDMVSEVDDVSTCRLGLALAIAQGL